MQSGSVAKAVLEAQGGHHSRALGDLGGCPPLGHEQHSGGGNPSHFLHEGENLRQIVGPVDHELDLVLGKPPQQRAQRRQIAAQPSMSISVRSNARIAEAASGMLDVESVVTLGEAAGPETEALPVAVWLTDNAESPTRSTRVWNAGSSQAASHSRSTLRATQNGSRSSRARSIHRK